MQRILIRIKFLSCSDCNQETLSYRRIFIQDDALQHYAKLMIGHFEKHFKDTKQLEWPKASPDPIENVWSIIKSGIQNKK